MIHTTKVLVKFEFLVKLGIPSISLISLIKPALKTSAVHFDLALKFELNIIKKVISHAEL